MRLAALAATLALAACATVPPPAPTPVDWAARQARLLSLKAWHMTGRVAVRVDGSGASASIDWRQSGGASDVAVSGPLGVGALRAELDDAGLRLQDASGSHLEGPAAEELLAERLGTAVPLRSLRYWLLGVPAPGEPVEASDGGPGRFVQSGWTVTFSRFEATPGGELPTRLTLEREGARLKLAVNRWELAP